MQALHSLPRLLADAIFDGADGGVQDKESLRGLLKQQFHHGVSPEVLRELNHGASRGQRAQDEGALPVSVKLGGGRASENVFNMAPVAISNMEF